MENTGAKTSAEMLEEIGQALQAERACQNLTCADISNQLRIPQRYIEHIEAGATDQLPAMTYVIGYVRSYANLLKLDAASICADLKKSLTADENNPQFDFVDQRLDQKANSGRTALAALIAGVLIYGGWYAFSTGLILAPQDQSSEQPIELALNAETKVEDEVEATFTKVAPRPVTEVVTETAEVTPEVTPEILPYQEELSNDAANNETAIAASETSEQPPFTPPVIEPQAEDVVTEELASVEESLESDVQPRVTDAVATNRIPEEEIILKATANSWVEVTRADGSAVSQRLMRTGERYVVPGGDDLFLTTGNAGGLEIQLGDAEPVVLGGWGEALRELPLDQTIISQRY